MKAKNILALKILFFSLLIFFYACNASKTQKGGAVGVGAGAVIGGIIGNQYDNTAAGAIIGATVGGATGAIIGRQMDKQAEELKADLEGAKVERVGEGIKITFDSGIMFETNSFTLNSEAISNLSSLASTLNKYDDTNILIEGHTDSSGSEEYNQELSVKRSNEVLKYLKDLEVSQSRMSAIGYGENQPIAENSSDAGMSQNRRVEVAIYANKKMKKAAEKGEI